MTSQQNPENKTIQTPGPPDFSLVLGGPLYQLFQRTRLSGDALELLRRRVLVITLFAWLPLLFLSVLDGHAFHGTIKIPFLADIEANVRFLVALPLIPGRHDSLPRRACPRARALFHVQWLRRPMRNDRTET